MKEAKGNIFLEPSDATCITTNGFVKSNGEAVMGKGCAREAAEHIPKLPAILGRLLRENGNRVQPLAVINDVHLLAFPVKPVHRPFFVEQDVVAHMRGKFKLHDDVPGWACVANLSIIEQSCKDLVKLTNLNDWNKVVLPRPGCGAGELSWDEVKPIMEQYLDDRFTCMTF